MAPKTLQRTVYVTGDDGAVTQYDAGTEYSEKLGEKITNPSAWGDGEPQPAAAAAEETGGEQTSEETGGEQTPEETGDDAAGIEDGGSAEELTEPPRSGRGSGREAWATYAEQKFDIAVPEGTDRDEIVAFLEERGLIEPSDDEPSDDEQPAS